MHSVASNFVTDVNSIRNAVATTVDGKPAVFISGLTGDVGCYTLDGQKIWMQASQTPAVMFKIVAADVNGDGCDELFTASADGHIACWGNDGRLCWRFNPGHKVRFSEVAVLSQEGHTRIYAGGNDFTLYELDRDGDYVDRLVAFGSRCGYLAGAS